MSSVAARRTHSTHGGRGARTQRSAAAPRARKPAPTKHRARAVSTAGYRAAMLAIALVTAVAVARVAVTCEAAEAAMDSGRIMEDIKGERLRADRLEIDKSALAAPSRIEGIAGQAMGMGSPQDVRYLAVADGGAGAETRTGQATEADAAQVTSAGGTPAQASQGSDGIARVLDAIARVAAEQAQVLLVGDVGLATASQ